MLVCSHRRPPVPLVATRPSILDAVSKAAVIAALVGSAWGLAACEDDGAPTTPGSETATRPSAQAEVAKPTPQEPSGFVVLSAGTPLHRRPSAEAALTTFDPRTSGSFGEAFGAFEVVGHEAEWIRIRNLRAAEAEQHCALGWEAMQDFALTFWVRKTSLQSVTRRPVVKTFDDGTSVMLAAGTPMMLTESDGDALRWTALGPGASAEVLLPEDAVGPFYRPSALYAPASAVSTLPRSTGLELEGRAIDNRPLRGASAIDVFATKERQDAALVTVGTRCAELRVMARGAAPSPLEDLDAEIAEKEASLAALERSSSGRRYALPEGAEAFWPDGEKAGELVAAHTFDSDPSVDSDKRCFEHAQLTLCFRAGDMTIEEPRGGGMLGLVAGEADGLFGEGFGGLGEAHGLGGGGFGVGAGGGLGSIGLGGSGGKKGKVTTGKAKVTGALDKQIIRRIIRAHMGEVRHCYEQGLADDASLEGRVEIQFTIADTGKVPMAVVKRSTVSDESVGNCIAKAVKRWTFPKPTGGGMVVVRYPFVLEPG
jgi:hypothetical protein